MGISLSVLLSVHPYKILVIMYQKLLQFVLKLCTSIEGLQDAILKCQLPLVEKLSPSEVRKNFVKFPVSVKVLVGVLSHIQ